MLSIPLCLAFGASGCSMDDVQLNGGIFDVVGLSDAAKAKSGSEPKIAARAPLVVPPSLDRLPEPGSEEAAENAEIAGIRDYDAVRTASKKDLERQQAEFALPRELGAPWGVVRRISLEEVPAGDLAMDSDGWTTVELTSKQILTVEFRDE